MGERAGPIKVVPEIHVLHPFCKGGVVGDDILVRSMVRASLPHENPTCFFYELGINDTGIVLEKAQRLVAMENRVDSLPIALWTE